MSNGNVTSINEFYTHNNFPQLSFESILRSYQSINHLRLNIKYSITNIFQNLIDKFESLRNMKRTMQLQKVHEIIIDILTKLYLTLKRWEKKFNNKLSIALYLLCKLNNYRNQYQSQHRYHNQMVIDLLHNNKTTHLIIQLEETMKSLKEKHNQETIEYNKFIMALKFHMLYFKCGIIFFDVTNSTNQERIASRPCRPEIVMFFKWIDKLKKYFDIYFQKEKKKIILNKSFNNWKTNLKLRRIISLFNFHFRTDIDSVAKDTTADYLRDKYKKVIDFISESYKYLLNRITLDVDENRNVYGEKYNYKNYINELNNVIKTKLLEKLLDDIRDLKNQLNSYKIKINYDVEKIEKLHKLLIVYTNKELVDHNKRLKEDFKLLTKKIKLSTLMVNRIEWAIVMKETILNDVILESKINLEKREVLL